MYFGLAFFTLLSLQSVNANVTLTHSNYAPACNLHKKMCFSLKQKVKCMTYYIKYLPRYKILEMSAKCSLTMYLIYIPIYIPIIVLFALLPYNTCSQRLNCLTFLWLCRVAAEWNRAWYSWLSTKAFGVKTQLNRVCMFTPWVSRSQRNKRKKTKQMPVSLSYIWHVIYSWCLSASCLM